MSEYVVKKVPAPLEAKVFQGGREVAEIRKNDDYSFTLTRQDDGKQWVLANRVHGQPRPFSIFVREAGAPEPAGKATHHDYLDLDSHDNDVLTINRHVFKHGGNFYMMTNNPRGGAPQSYLSGPRYISRLDNFPHEELAEVGVHDRHGGASHKLKRFRGVPVGEATGLGISESGHRVKVEGELEDIGLFVAASSYLMYASA